jgi:hypothetical protein
MSQHSSEFDDLSEYSYGSAETDHTASIDTVEELLQRFTLDCRPDCTLKLRNTYAILPFLVVRLYRMHSVQ